LSCSCKRFGQKKPCKKSADIRPRQGNFTTLEHFYRSQQNLSSLHKIGWAGDQLKKICPFFFNMRVLDLDFSDKNTAKFDGA
jgi:hypothetical protein